MGVDVDVEVTTSAQQIMNLKIRTRVALVTVYSSYIYINVCMRISLCDFEYIHNRADPGPRGGANFVPEYYSTPGDLQVGE